MTTKSNKYFMPHKHTNNETGVAVSSSEPISSNNINDEFES